jgi:hypothetical protein
MAIDPITMALLAAIGALSTTCAALYARGEKLHATLSEDRRRASDLIFALLQQRRQERGERAPPTVTEWSDEPTTQVVDRAFIEAQAHASREVNGEIEELVQRYLRGDSTPPAARRVDANAATLRVSDKVRLEAERRIAERRKGEK